MGLIILLLVIFIIVILSHEFALYRRQMSTS